VAEEIVVNNFLSLSRGHKMAEKNRVKLFGENRFASKLNL
jgi:hypothetical protein